MKNILLALSCSLLVTMNGFAQTDNTEDKPIIYEQKQPPVGLDNYQAGFYYYNGKNVYTMRSFKVASGTDIKSLKINPAGSSYAYIDTKKDKSAVVINDLWKANKELGKLESKDYQPLAICYSADSKTLFMTASDNTIKMFDTKTLKELSKLNAENTTTRLDASPNGYYLLGSDDNNIVVYNVEAQSVRTRLSSPAAIKDIAFSQNSKLLAVLTADGCCKVYDTRTFQVKYSYESLGIAESCFFHPENKYLAVVTGDQRVAIINILNNKDRHYIDAVSSGVNYVNFVKNTGNGIYLVYNTSNSIVFNPVFFLSPNRQQLLTEELNSRMEEWEKRMDGESLEDYNLRVNDETRMQQMRLFEQDIATRMADNLMSMSEVSLGNYNQEMGMLTLDFNTMPSIYLSVPADQLSDFSDPSVLQFTNNKYCVNDNDEFELVYTEVVNTKTGKKYVFDNTERKSLAFLESDENFVPFEQLQMSQMETLKLEEIKNDIVANAKAKNLISDHTKIDVKTKVVNSVNDMGNKIANYEVSVSYTVGDEYSAKDDFGSGKFKTEESNAAKSMLAVVKQALEDDLSKYVVAGKQVKVMVTGMADATPFSRTVAYDGCYGDIEREPVYKDGQLNNITVTRATGISDNDQLAFLRASGCKDYMVKNIPSLSTMKTTYDTSIEVSSKAGSKYRRIGVKLTFVDAL